MPYVAASSRKVESLRNPEWTVPAPVRQAGGVNLVDSFFRQSAWTREDFMVAATVVQLVAFGFLLYHQVSDS